MGMRLLPVTDSVYCVYRPSYFNCTYIVVDEDDVTLIDTCMQSNGRDTLAALDQLSIPIERIRRILVTHWHNDHTAGCRVIREQSGCEIYCHPKDRSYLEGGLIPRGFRGLARLVPEMGPLVLIKGLLGGVVPKSTTIDHVVDDGDLVADRFVVVHTPGHTSGHVAYYDQRTKVLFAGDALAVIRGRLRFMSRPVTLDRQAAWSSMQRLMDFECTAICPGHRSPLSDGLDAERTRFRSLLEAKGRWPLFG